MFSLWPCVLYVLGCAGPIAAQSSPYQWTVDVTSQPPVPGKPFTLTWTGGESSEAVYITLNNFFPPLPNQNIPYGSIDILSNAPNNGSWIWNVPLDITAGHHSFSIGYNPFMLSATTGIFIISPSEVSPASPLPSPSTTALPLYNGCGLPPLPDFTYTGYQPPCTITTSGRIETIFPIVPASDSSLFYGNGVPGTAPTSDSVPLDPTTTFDSGVFAQALQCATAVTPTTTSFAVSSTTTVISLVGCMPIESINRPGANSNGVCHTSGYTTYSVGVGSYDVCCPEGWATTPLLSGIFCFTSMTAGELDKAALDSRAGLTTTLSGLAFTSAGAVAAEATTGAMSATAESGTTASTPKQTGAGATNNSNRTRIPRVGIWGSLGIMLITGVINQLLSP